MLLNFSNGVQSYLIKKQGQHMSIICYNFMNGIFDSRTLSNFKTFVDF